MNIKNQFVKILFAVVIAFTAFSCTDEDKQEITKLPTIVEIASADANYSIFVRLVKTCGLANTFSAPGSYTIFAPDNAAFATIGITDAKIDVLDANPLLLANATNIATYKKVLQNHVVNIGTRIVDLIPSVSNTGYNKSFATVGTSTTTFFSFYVNNSSGVAKINGGSALTGGANVVKQDIDASNGVVHLIDRVIAFPKLTTFIAADPELSFLNNIIKSTATSVAPFTFGDQTAVFGILNGAGPASLFAPTNSAFDAATSVTGFYNNAITAGIDTPANTTKLLQYHATGAFLSAASATSWTSATATTDVIVSTLAPTAQTFKITKGTLKITELPAIVLPAIAPPVCNIKTVNIIGINGNLHIIDRVLKPILP